MHGICPVSSLPDRQEVTLPTGRISYRQAGSGPDLVLLHGLAGNSGTWERQFEEFAGRFRMTAWDAPGYGHSDTVARYISRVADAAKKFSMPVGIHIYSVDEREELDHRIEQGFQLLTVMLDTALFYQACVRVLKAVRPQ